MQYHKELRAPEEDKVPSTNELSESDDVVVSGMSIMRIN